MAIEALKKIMVAEQKAQKLSDETEENIQKLVTTTQNQLKKERQEVQEALKKLQGDLKLSNQERENEYAGAVSREKGRVLEKIKQTQTDKSSEAVAQILLEVQQRYGNH